MPVRTFGSFDDFKAVVSFTLSTFSQLITILTIRQINGDKPVVIDFWATWCGPCRVISPIFEKFADDVSFDGVEFYKVDVDEQEQIAQEVGVRAVCRISWYFLFFH